MSEVKTPPVRRTRWWIVLLLSLAGGLAALVAAILTVNAGMDAVSNEQGELRIAVFGSVLLQERGPWQPLESKMYVYGWSLIGGFAAAGMLLGAGIGLGLSRLTNR